MSLLSRLLDLVAPRITFSRKVDLPKGASLDDFLDFVSKELEVRVRREGFVSGKMKGDFFADSASKQVVFGKDADPDHYRNVAFKVTFEREGRDVRLTVDDRVILGHLEMKAVRTALENRMDRVIERAKRHV